MILSNGSETKVGSTFARWERFGEWKRVEDENEVGLVSLETAIRGLCQPRRLLDIVENFVAYLERPGGLQKLLAQNHQVLGVNAAMRALRDERTREGRLGFEFIALRDASMEALLVDAVTRRAYLERSDRVRRLFSAILPDPAAQSHARLVGVARNLAERMRSLDEPADLSTISGPVSALLDRSVGAEEYVIRAAADGTDADGLIDLNSIDFEALAARLAGRKRSAAQRLAGEVGDRIGASARRNPSRLDLVTRLRELIDEYNAGSLNVDEMLRRLQSLSKELSEDEQRTAREGLSESELAIFDLLTQPDPTLTEEQRAEVKAVARKLMEHITERLVLDWRKKAETVAAARGLVQDVLDELPDAYDPETWRRKSDAVFDHIFASFYDDGRSVYDTPEPSPAGVATAVAPPSTRRSSAGAIDIDEVTQAVLDRIKSDAKFAEQVAEQLRGKKAFFAVSTHGGRDAADRRQRRW